MRALVYLGTEHLDMQDLPEPEPGPGQSVVDLAFCGICGSDMHAYHGADERRVPPLVLGHEAVGVVRGGRLAGKRVAINPLMHCGSCRFCQAAQVHLCERRALIGLFSHGAFAERVAIAEDNLSVLPDDLPLERAVLAEPLAVCVHAARVGHARHAGPTDDLQVAVLGGGAIGLLGAMVYRTMGVGGNRGRLWIAETGETRRRMLGPVIEADIYDPRTGGPEDHSIDIVFDAVGSGATRAAASRLVRPGGTIVHVGLQDIAEGLDTRYLTLQEVTFVGTYCYTPADFAEALRLLHTGAVTGAGWTEFRPLEAGAESFRDIDAGAAPPKIVLTM